MKNFPNELLDNGCWVYVRQDGRGTYIIGITFDEEFRHREASPKQPLLLWRRFDDILLAAGYRIALNRLSRTTLEKILKDQRADAKRKGRERSP